MIRRTKNREAGWGPSTRCVWGGEPEQMPEGVTVMPVFHGVTFGYDDVEAWREVGEGRRDGYVYSRNRNPTVEAFEAKITALEGAEAGTTFSTGMAAVSNTLFALLAPGRRVVSILTEFLPQYGVEVELCDTRDHEAIEAALAKRTDILYLESPTNPTLEVLDIARLASRGHAAGATVVVDNTFATPINQRPLELGADLVIHSATKFLGGHSDALGGVVVGSPLLVERIFRFREINGASLDPHSAFLLTRGLKTLELRVARQNENAQRVAEYLARHPAVEAVFYPGLPDHPQHEVARRQMRGFGGVLSFSLRADQDGFRRFLNSLRLAHRAASLGSVGTLVGPPATTSHVELTREERARAGIPETLLRYSVGIENVEDLIEDLRSALAAMPTGPA
jgi:cystathionine gamma-synthase